MIGRAAKFALVLTAVALCGCQRENIEGIVRNIEGEPVPGVAVRVSSSKREALTDARGHFRIASRRGIVTLDFAKSGYAPARMELDDSRAARDSRNEVAIWKLPSNAGVYILDEFRYRQVAWVIPRQFFMTDGTVAFGTQAEPSPVVHTSEPFIICYRTPRYDARLSRLVLGEAKQSASKGGSVEVWTDAGGVDADLLPVDEPQGVLRRLRIGRKLEPGVYALHWGALEGYKTLENRMFIFRVEPAAAGIRPVNHASEAPSSERGSGGSGA